MPKLIKFYFREVLQSVDEIVYRPWRTMQLVGIAAATVLLAAQALAQALPDLPIGNPSPARLVPLIERLADAAEMALAVPSETRVLPVNRGEVAWTATVAYTDAKIFNPRTGKFDKVRLRSYQSDSVDPTVPFVAPTVELQPGETFRLTLDNKLPADDPSCLESGNANVPHCFNSTNMHSHGLWVSPAANSDNVLIRVNPGVAFTYEYNIPADHPAGAFWYHPHLHGSTALQVSSGMAGALIIRGERLPALHRPGDIDTLLRNSDGSPFAERLVLFQQIPYACRDGNGQIKTDAQGLWICDSGDVGTIEDYDQFGQPAWKRSGRYTTINGRVTPTFADGVTGRIERWRLIHAGVRDSIKLRFRKRSENAPAIASAAAYDAMTAEAQAAFVEANCGGADVPQLSLATDGLTRERLVEQTESNLYPGYREDLLVVFPEPGTYCLIDEEAPTNEAVNEQSRSRQLLGFVKVGEGTSPAEQHLTDYVRQQLIQAARQHMPEAIRETIVADLEQRLGLAAFVPHSSLVDLPIIGTRTLGFTIRFGPGGAVFQIGKLDPSGALSNPRSYLPGRIDQELILGNVEEWRLRSFLGGHPFHIHVNPFQVIEVLDPQGNDVSGYEAGNTSPYARLKGAWKDTLFITQNQSRQPYTVVVKTRYRRYIGDFVLHCHILDHEDQGMMQNVRISLPDGRGGITAAHH